MTYRQLFACGAMLLFGSIACWFFPLFHIRAMNSSVSFQLAEETKTEEPRNLEAYATGTEVTQLWSAFDSDTSKAQSQFGRQSGIGGAWYFRVQGTGMVDSIDKNRLVLSIADSPRRVSLEMGVVVDNTVREAIGFRASDFPNSQDFNAVSTELNRQVEQDVIAPNRTRLKPGVSVSFVGCAKINGKSDLDPLRLIPISIQSLDIEGGVRFQPAEPWKGSSGKLEAYPTEKSP